MNKLIITIITIFTCLSLFGCVEFYYLDEDNEFTTKPINDNHYEFIQNNVNQDNIESYISIDNQNNEEYITEIIINQNQDDNENKNHESQEVINDSEINNSNTWTIEIPTIYKTDIINNLNNGEWSYRYDIKNDQFILILYNIKNLNLTNFSWIDAYNAKDYIISDNLYYYCRPGSNDDCIEINSCKLPEYQSNFQLWACFNSFCINYVEPTCSDLKSEINFDFDDLYPDTFIHDHSYTLLNILILIGMSVVNNALEMQYIVAQEQYL